MYKKRILFPWHWPIFSSVFLVGILVTLAPNIASALPNLRVYYLRVSPTSLEQGAAFNLTYEVRNFGDMGVRDAKVRFYFSTNSTITTSDTYLRYEAKVSATRYGGSSGRKTVRLYLPANALVSYRYIGAIVNWDKSLPESNYSDNTRSTRIYVRSAKTQDLVLKDLVITNYSVLPPGSGFNVTATVGNEGTTTVGSSHLRFYLSKDKNITTSDIYLGRDIAVPSMNANATLKYNAILGIPANTQPGQYYVGAIIDYNNTVKESNETNNTYAQPITVTSGPMADLEVPMIHLWSSRLYQGNKVRVYFTLRNRGKLDVLNLKTRIYLSRDRSITTRDTYLGEYTLSLIRAGQTTSRIGVDVYIPANARTGTQYLGIYTDYDNKVAEFDEKNNTIYQEVSIRGAYVTDLTITNFTASPTVIVRGSSFNFSYVMKNLGSRSSSTFATSLYLSYDKKYSRGDVSLGYTIGTSLSGGSSKSFRGKATIPATVRPGSYYLLLFIDSKSQIRETNETNNVIAIPITVTAKGYADLIVDYLNISPLTSQRGGKVRVFFKIKNIGTVAAKNIKSRVYLSFDSNISAGDIYLKAESTTTTLNAGQTSQVYSYTVTLPANAYLGNHWIGVYTDTGYTVPESSERNNTKAISINIRDAKTQDMTLDYLYLYVSSVEQGKNVSFRYRVRNNGTLDLKDFVIRAYLSKDDKITTSDIYLNYEKKISLLRAGYYLYISGSVTIPKTVKGSYYLGFFADYNNKIRETDETNNTIARPLVITVPNQADLIIDVFNPNGRSAYQGNRLTIHYRVNNVGTANANNIKVRFYLSTNDTITRYDTYLNVEKTFNLRSKQNSGYQTVSVYIPSNAQLGQQYIGAIVDYNNAIAESDETNNTAKRPLTILARMTRDLTITAIRVPSSAKRGQTIGVRYYVKNSGNTDITTPFVINLYLSTDSNISTSDTYLGGRRVSSLKIGQTLTFMSNVKIPTNAQLGKMFIGAFVDARNQVGENDETNNTRSTPINITTNLPDFTISYLSISPVIQEQNNVVKVSFRVYNDGWATAGASTLRVYLSQNSYIDAADLAVGNVNIPSLKAKSGTRTLTTTITIPSSYPIGNAWIGVMANYNRKVREATYNNNTAAKSITIRQKPKVDLQISDFSISASSVPAGKSLTVRFRIYNAGPDKISKPFSTRIYLSTNSIISVSDTYLANGGTLNSLAAKAHSPTYTVKVTIPANTKIGSYYIGVLTDYSKQIAETNESNNYKALRLKVVAPPKADLQIAAFNVSPSSGAVGAKLTLSYRLFNAGGTTATNFKTRFYLSKDTKYDSKDTYLGKELATSKLDPNAYLPSKTGYFKTTIQIPQVAAGKYYIIAFVDYANVVSESSETNNTRSAGISVSPTPKVDFVALSAVPTPNEALVGSKISLAYKIKNAGNKDASRYTVRVYFSKDKVIDTKDTMLLSFSRTSLAKGATASGTRTITLPTSLAAGKGYIGIFVDPLDAYKEADEKNNTVANPFTVLVDKDKDGVPNNVDCDDNDKTVYPAYKGKPAAKEICDNKDNNCNKQIDENITRSCFSGKTGCTQKADGSYQCVGLCKAGTQKCSAGKWSQCSNEVLPSKEVCNGKDDDCDGTVDNNNVCKEPTPEVSPEPTVDAGPEALPESSAEPTPEASTEMSTEKAPEGTSSEQLPETTAETSTEMTPTEITPDASCYEKGCPSGEVCQNGQCVPDPCDGVSCQNDEFCRAGQCVKACGCTTCAQGEICVDGQCQNDPCAGVSCAQDEVCDENGQCVPDACKSVTCGKGRICKAGQCVDDPCNNIQCPNDMECKKGQCVGLHCDEQTTEMTSETVADVDAGDVADVDAGDVADVDAGDVADVDAGDVADIDAGQADSTPEASVGDKTVGYEGSSLTDGDEPVASGGCCSTAGKTNPSIWLLMFFFLLVPFFRRRRS